MRFDRFLQQRLKGYWRQAVAMLLFSILFSTVILGCIVVFSAADSARRNVGRYVEGDIRLYSYGKDTYERYTLEGEKIPYEWIQKIAEDDRVRDYKVTSMAGVDGVDIRNVEEILVSDMGEMATEQLKDMYDFSGGSLSLVYESDMMDFYRFAEYGESIVEGRALNREEKGNKAVLGMQIAEDAGLSVGDTFEVETMSGDRIPLEIVGISSFTASGGESAALARSMYYEYIFTTKEVVDRANGKEDVCEVVFELADCGQADTFLASIQEEIQSGDYQVNKNLSGFYSASQVFENIQVTMSLLLVTGALLGAFLIVLFAMYSIVGRVKEIGILTAMGMNRGMIVLQYVLEMLVPVLAGNVLCLGVFFACKGWMEAMLTGWFGNMGEVTISLGMRQLTLYLGISLFMVLFAVLYVGYKAAFCKPKELIVEPS